MRAMKKSLLLSLLLSLLVAFTLSGCDQLEKEQSHLKELQAEASKQIGEMQRLFEEIKPKGSDLTGQATEEVEKLFIFEYEVFEVDRSKSAKELTGILQQHGKERWECFYIEQLVDSLRIYCKRRPKSYLRYIPRWFPG